MKTFTIRNVAPDLTVALEAEALQRGLSLNRTVLALLREALCLSEKTERGNGLRRLAGSWTEDEFREFERAVRSFRETDEELWCQRGS